MGKPDAARIALAADFIREEYADDSNGNKGTQVLVRFESLRDSIASILQLNRDLVSENSDLLGKLNDANLQNRVLEAHLRDLIEVVKPHHIWASTGARVSDHETCETCAILERGLQKRVDQSPKKCEGCDTMPSVDGGLCDECYLAKFGKERGCEADMHDWGSMPQDAEGYDAKCRKCRDRKET